MSSPLPTVTVMAGEAAAPYAVVIAGERSSRHLLELGRPLVIGRAEDCDLRVDDASVSRRHAQLELDGSGGGALTDLGSHNGTRLNGRPVTGSSSTRVAAGDVVTVGSATLVLYIGRRQRPRGGFGGPILDRLDAEVDRARRYDGTLALVVWQAPPDGAPLIASLLRACDVAGVTSDGQLAAVLPELDGDQAEEVARRAVDLLRVAAPGARAGLAVFPADGADADTLLAAARAAAAAAPPAEGGDVARAQRTVQRISLGEQAVIVADPGVVGAYDLLRRLAASDLPVLVAGETGVGKELAARALHTFSPRARGPFVAVNCAAVPENLVESELFGHRRGAFSGADRDKVGYFESAAGGTLFLDEIAELPLAAQAKLLRAVDTRSVTRLGTTESTPVDLRFVAATNRDLAAEVAAERFRADLFYRLSAAVVVLPPLRDRPREIAELARTFVARARVRLARPPLAISDGAMRRLMERRYPGNVRELANAMEYAAAVADGDTVEAWHLPAELATATTAAAARPDAQPPAVAFRPIADEVAELERRRMKEALIASGGNQSQAADLISMPRRTFVTKMGKYGLR